MTSVLFLYPTLRDKASQVPRATSVPSMIIGGVYSMTFFTLGMTFSAFGSFAACTMWSLIAAFRNPDSESMLDGTPIPPVSEWRERLRGLGGQVDDAGTSPSETADDFDAAPNSD